MIPSFDNLPNVIEILETPGGYCLVTHISDLDDETKITSAYTPGGVYIGNPTISALLCDELGIAPEPADPGDHYCSVGFCEREQKWYGWSHRAYTSFGIGSTVKPGDCAYTASTPEEMIEQRVQFWSDMGPERMEQARAECQVLPDRSGIRILPTPIKMKMASSPAHLIDALDGSTADLPEETLFSNDVLIEKCGRGEWTAKTLDDARQMACDYAKSVA